MADAQLRELIHGRLAGLLPERIVCLTGAGVSANPPTSLPLAYALTRRVFDELFEPDALDVVLGYHEALGLRSSDPCASRPGVRLPRLETVLGVAARVHGETRALRVLDGLRVARPNPLHAVFAAHVLHGGWHITANFDTCIEALLPAGFDGSSRLWHFHGSLGSDGSGETLGATLAAIERGFDPRSVGRLHGFLKAGDVILVFGYSGSDFFDVDPAVARLPRSALAGRRVVWFAHAPSTSAPRLPQDHDPPLVSLLAAAGAEVTIVCAPTPVVCSLLGEMWQPPGPLTDLVPPTPAEPPSPPTPAMRSAATFELYRELRLHREVAVRLAHPPRTVSPEECWRARAELLWERGRFKTAMVGWASSSSKIPAWERAERIGAALWEQGRLVPAWLWLAAHRHRLDPAAEYPRLRLLETEGRVVLRMLETPELRWLGWRLAPLIVERLEDTGRDVGLHMYQRARDIAARLASAVGLDSSADVNTGEGESWFLEAGDLTAVLAYRHARYRRTYDDSADSHELAIRYLTQERDKELVGSSGVRTRQLPGAARVWTLRQYALSLLEVQYGWWHRARLLARFIVDRRRQSAES